MQPNKVDTKRRKLIGSTLGLGVIGTALPSSWSTPLVSAVVTPAHAEMSPIVMCPMLVIENILISTGSGQPVPCQISFDLVSSDPAIPLTITSVSADPMGGASFDGGNRVTWLGDSSNCVPGGPAQIPTDVVFTVEAACDAAPDPVTQMFNLTDLEGVSLAATT